MEFSDEKLKQKGFFHSVKGEVSNKFILQKEGRSFCTVTVNFSKGYGKGETDS
jgi:hypothetical protein